VLGHVCCGCARAKDETDRGWLLYIDTLIGVAFHGIGEVRHGLVEDVRAMLHGGFSAMLPCASATILVTHTSQ